LGIEVRTLADYPQAWWWSRMEVRLPRTPKLKAVEQAKHLGQWVLSDDSGLCVDALGGAPGVDSAIYAGPQADDAANNRRLLEELAATPLERRSAHYVCHVVLADPQGTVRASARGALPRSHSQRTHGEAGFGYDPYFEIIEYHRTFAELGLAVKACFEPSRAGLATIAAGHHWADRHGPVAIVAVPKLARAWANHCRGLSRSNAPTAGTVATKPGAKKIGPGMMAEARQDEIRPAAGMARL